MKLAKENLKKDCSYIWEKNVIIFLNSMSFFILNSKRESKYYIVDIIYNIILIYFYWVIVDDFYDFRFMIIFYDFFLKMAFYKGVVGNLKNLLYLPISVIQKKLILFFLPLISFTNLALLSLLVYNEFVIFLFMIINSFFIFNLKTNRTEIFHFLFFYTISSFLFFFLNEQKSLLSFFVILVAFLIVTIKRLNSYLKFN